MYLTVEQCATLKADILASPDCSSIPHTSVPVDDIMRNGMDWDVIP